MTKTNPALVINLAYPDAPRENDPLGSSVRVEDRGDRQRRLIQVQRVAKRVVFLLAIIQGCGYVT